jgi:PadR family transcriptional regulator PadR
MAVPDSSVGERESLLLRGVIDMCVLALLAVKPNHAYGVVRQLQGQGFAQTSYGTVYPLVTRLRRQGLIQQESHPSPGGPARNVLTLTRAGHAALRDWRRQWEDSNHRVAAILDQTPRWDEATERKAHV